MKPFDEDWQDDSVRNYNAKENSDSQSGRKSYNPNFTSDNKLRGGDGDAPRRPRKRVGEATSYTPQESEYSSRGGYRPRNNYNGGGYNNGGNRGGYSNNRGGYNGGNRGYNNYNNGGNDGGYGNNRNFGGNFNNAYKFEVNFDEDGNKSESSEKPQSYNRGGYNNGGNSYGNNRGGGYNNGGNRGGYNNGGYSNNGGNRGGYSNNGGNRGGYNNNNGGNRGGYNNNNNNGGNRSNNNFRGNNKPQGGRPNGNKGGQNRNLTRPIEYKSIVEDPNEEIRLNKFLANAGICSRREADELIQTGVISVNGQVVSELGAKILRGDKVMIHDQLVSPDKRIYLLLNKPKDCVTTSDDPYAKTTVMDLVKNACRERIYPVGRLDRNTTGVLLLTNDGDLSAKLTHPKYNKKKIYQVTLDKPLEQEHLDQMLAGIELEDGEIKADDLQFNDPEDNRKVGIEIHSGRNRIVRRIFEHFGYRVIRLDRVYFAGLTKKNLKRGQWRFLTEKEVSMLRMGAFE